MIETIINSYFKYINLPFTRRSFPRGLKFIYHCVLLTDLIQAIIFPTLSDLCIYSVFGDSVFISHISALHHMGATLGGLYWCLISYFNLTNVMYNTPLFSSVLTYLHLIIYARYYTYKGRMFHIIWHTSYYTIYSSMNVALTNLIVLSIKSMDKGGFIVHYNVLARIGHIVGPLLNILVTFLPPLKRSFFYFNSIKFENLEYIYVSYVLKNEPRPTAMALYSNDIIKESGTYFQKDSANYSQGRYKYLPWTIFVMNTLTTFGSGLSISLMSIYMIKTFNIDYMYLWIGSLLIPVITTLLLFVLNSQQKKYGKLPTIFISKIIALGLLFYFGYSRDVVVIMIVYVLRASFQNAPGPLKTSILLQCSNLESAGYWLSSEYLTRIIMAVTTVVGGQIVHMYGFHRCFLMTALFYTISLLILLITMLVFPNVLKMSQSSGLGSDLNHLTAAQRSAVLDRLNQIQYQDTMDTYNGLVERCFNECITGFRSKDLDMKESQCVESCVKLFFDFSQRVSTRFGEKQSKI
nr:hypothetical protein MACL_00001109 [Theileria orientalis]